MKHRPLLFVGNKRSGTTILTYVLNQHNRIYVGNEIDVVWYLVHEAENKNNYGCKALYFKHVIEELPENRREAFLQVCLNFKDSLIPGFTEDYANKENEVLRFVGDKSPLRHLHGSSVAFIKKHLTDAIFIHIVRDPCTAINSMLGTCFRQRDPMWETDRIFGAPVERNLVEVTKIWVQVEKRALELYSGNCIHIRYEDLCDNKEKEMCRVYEILDLDPSDVNPMKRGSVLGTRYAEGYRRGYRQIPDVPGLGELRKLYGYVK